MTLETQNSGVLEGVTEEDLSRVFDDDDLRGGFLILTSDDGSFLQAAGKGRSPIRWSFFKGRTIVAFPHARARQSARTALDPRIAPANRSKFDSIIEAPA